MVRHPFERIISAYLDKLSNYNRDLKFRYGLKKEPIHNSDDIK